MRSQEYQPEICYYSLAAPFLLTPHSLLLTPYPSRLTPYASRSPNGKPDKEHGIDPIGRQDGAAKSPL